MPNDKNLRAGGTNREALGRWRAATRAAAVAAVCFLVVLDGDDGLDAAAAQIRAAGGPLVGLVADRPAGPGADTVLAVGSPLSLPGSVTARTVPALSVASFTTAASSASMARSRSLASAAVD